MKLSNTLLGAIAVANADDHGMCERYLLEILIFGLENFFQLINMGLVSRMNNLTEFCRFISERQTVSKSV